ncbi:MAG: hypothetical protein HYX75_01875 [Acidobacteria bacterium]|nr:hypothetical protein [Acidobacteriota bacterium]
MMRREFLVRSVFVGFLILATGGIVDAAGKEPGAVGMPSAGTVSARVFNPLAQRSARPPQEMRENLSRINPMRADVRAEELRAGPPGYADRSVPGEPEVVRSRLQMSQPFQDPMYPGISFTGWIPPDCHMAASPSHVLLVVNSHFQAFNTSNGGAAFSAVSMGDWFADVLVDNEFVFDPKAVWDPDSKRFLILGMSADFDTGASGWVISASQTSDPAGSWWIYRLDGTLDGSTPTSNWADYPGFGIDKKAVYMTANMFGPTSFAYTKCRIINKATLYAGGTLGWYDFFKLTDGSEYVFTLQAAQSSPSNSFNFLINSKWGNSSTRLTVWKITNPTSSKPTLKGWNLTVPSFSLPPNAKQKGGGIPINVGDDRLLNAVIRSGKLYTAHAIAANWGSGTVSAARWYELSVSGSTPKLLQSGTYGLDKYDYYYPVVLPDSAGNVYMVFNRSSQTEYVGVRATGRQAGDPVGQMDPSIQISAGKANYRNLDGQGRNRWGDYNGIALDAASTGKVWIFSEYAGSKTKWGTTFSRITFSSE